MMYSWSGYDDGLKTASVTVLYIYDCFIIFSRRNYHRGDEEGLGGALVTNFVVTLPFTATSNTSLMAYPLHQF